ncbi:hypothetical protein FOYG_05589 [Fusarium oxysporum NRRL 32931]|uniref:Uncharacterized protein n=1 Tax=Fusarium oxysporum NRRL 32931 TaxID=660029 RepID=W9IQ78_FUSOX|nr:hypothetical protein FOYG_05589 [Fusarium oxysporum NRRL 32931]
MKRSTIFLRNESRPMMTPGLPKASVRGTQKWAPGEMEMESSKKFATERELPERPEVPDEDEDSNFNIDMQPFYDREQDEYLLRIENSPRWDWGRDAQGDLWYWQVSGTAGHATETWRFENKGEYAYGNEPLDFWDDWYDDRGMRLRRHPTAGIWSLFPSVMNLAVRFRSGTHANPYVVIV